MPRRPLVAIVGRPNVGKSTLFNRLIGERRAVVNDVPGTTRDRLVGTAEWLDRVFDVVDTGGLDPTAASRGKEPLSVDSAPFIDAIRQQAAEAIQAADAVLFVVDAESGVTAADRAVAETLRRLQQRKGDKPHPPVLLVVNKVDSDQKAEDLYAFYELGFGDPIPISALHGRGLGDMLDRLLEIIPWAPRFDEQTDDEDVPKLAIVGRPNVGKSSLLNRLLGQERVLVSDIPGTTRDAVDTRLRYFGQDVVLIDTAGIRRKGRIEPGVEKYSVLRALRALQRADVALLVIDATEGVTAQDAHIGGYIQDAGASVVIVVNKWDAIEKDAYTMNRFTEHVRRALHFLDYAPILYVSAKTGQRVGQILPTALEVYQARYTRLPTSLVNRIIGDAVDQHPPPPMKGSKALKIYFAAQVGVAPPTFMLRVNDPKLAHFSYLRYLENRLREAHPFPGTPIRLLLKERERRKKGKRAK
ncbi:MAG: ribosome biogenesis GTPase Der [Chloroflexi bacterium]|nr:ribosome biogenesis GTPase Der [Chloroflexota bacterium]